MTINRELSLVTTFPSSADVENYKARNDVKEGDTSFGREIFMTTLKIVVQPQRIAPIPRTG